MTKKRFAALFLLLIVTTVSVAAEEPTRKRDRVVVRNGQVIGGDDDVIVLRPGELLLKGPYLGVSTMALTDELRTHFGVPKDSGVMISSVGENTPAAKAGLKAGDIITAVDGKKVDSSGALSRAIREKEKGAQVRVEFRRNGANQQVFATLAEREGMNFGEFRIDKDFIREPVIIGEEAVERMTTFFNSPEWRDRLESIQDCGRVQARVRELETRLKELEKKIGEKK
jgi:membrane-associated protease RseP (regulator of RpoE activity)